MAAVKSCRQCTVEKPLSEFHKHPHMGDGHLNICMVCIRLNVSNRLEQKKKDPTWMKQERERCRLKQAKLRQQGRGGKTSNTAKHAWRKRNPTKTRAHGVAQNTHKVRPDICGKCKKPADTLHRHHPDYTKPKEIIWVCPKCHGEIHRKD